MASNKPRDMAASVRQRLLGAMLFRLWGEPDFRSTKDLDPSKSKRRDMNHRH